MKTLLRGAITGAGYGLAVGCVDTWLGARFVIQNHMSPPLGFMLQGGLLCLALGLGLGLLLVPLLRLRGGHLYQLVAVAVAWVGLAIYAAPSNARLRAFSLLGPFAGFALFLLGRWIGRRRPWLPVAIGVVVLVGALATSDLYVRLSTPPGPPRAALSPAPEDAPDIVIVVLDTVRADHVGIYGYGRPTTPRFDALAREGVVFMDATAPATWSVPSHASLFTGLFPSGHGAHDEHHFLDPGPPTLGEVFSAAGYDTRCFTANGWISDGLGLTRGFAWSDDAWRSGALGRAFGFIYRFLDRLGLGMADKGGADVASHFEHWVETRPKDAPPVYAFLNFIEAHFPYHQVPEDYLARFTSLSRGELRALSLRLFAAQFGAELLDPTEAKKPAIAMYDAGVLYSDHLLGRVVDALRRRGSLDHTILVVLSDHGELLGENGKFGHGASLHEAMVRVPLLVRFPPRIPAGTRVSMPVSTVGVFATVLDLAGIAPTAPVHVGSLLPALSEKPAGAPVLAERYAGALDTGNAQGRPLSRKGVRLRSYRVGTWKLIETSSGETYLFDLGNDPEEVHDLALASAEETARLKVELDTWRAALALPAIDAPVGREEAPPLDPAARERLRALGYVE